ncbi:MAG: M48 family metallopeptidase [Legionella sp.]|nr:M48 family metallopeptidase [Legionella sp.]
MLDTFFILRIGLLIGSFACSNAFALSPYSTEELDALEKAFIQNINQSNEVERNPLAVQYINRLGHKLAHFGGLTPPTFFLVKSNEINAFAGPGGYIGVNTRLILASDNESELAAVMAHEMAHVRLHHLYRMLEHQKQMKLPMIASLLASIALGVINPTLATGALMTTMGGFAQNNLNFTRSNEKEADRIGMEILIKSGFNPRSMSAFFKKMEENTRYYFTDNVPAILRTHPLDADRIAEAENRTTHLPKKTYTSSNDYLLFKELLRVSTSSSQELLDFYHHQQQQGCKTTCEYGIALTLMDLNQYRQAAVHFENLARQDPNNLFYQLPLAQARIGQQLYDPALQQLATLKADYPENYAVTVIYGQSLMAAGKPAEASMVLLKGTRQFKNDLPLCSLLARAQADAGRKSYAYFTLAQCQLLQGKKQAAMQQLQEAKKLAKKDAYLQARISATLDEL